MYQKDFIPIVLKVKFKSERPIDFEKWQQLIGNLLLEYAQRISKKEGCFIGHIKALAEISEFSYIKFSCINASAGVNSEFHGDLGSTNKINMMINSLVTNIDVWESRKLLNQSGMLTINQEEYITMEVENETSQAPEEHHHHEGNGPCPICEKKHHHTHN